MRRLALVAALFGFVALLGAGTAHAGLTSFNYNYTGTQGETAMGTLTGSLVSPGVYDITSGTITLSSVGDPALDATGVFVPVPTTASFNFYTGGGTILTYPAGTDNRLYPASSQLIDVYGAFLFSMNGFNVLNGQGNTGFGLTIFSNEPQGPGYGAWGGNWALVDYGNGVFSVSAVPIPPSAFMLVSGLIGLVGLKRRFKA